MATINFATREITTKIVYFGASGAGCNTNVERLWNLVEGRKKSALHRFGPKDQQERSWYFDFVPTADPPVDGFQLCWRIYSLPGGIPVVAHREEVVSGVDAVVFVADARADRSQTNLDHLLELEALLTSIGLELSAMPVVIQVNHCDATDARPTDEVVFDLNPYNFPVIEAVAKEGSGVEQTHLELSGAVLARVRDTLAGQDTITLTAVHSEPLSDAEVIRQHVETIQARSEATPHATVEVHADDGQMPEGPVVEVAFQPREFVGSHPMRVLATAIEGDKVQVALEMTRMGGGESRRLIVLLLNRPVDSPAIPSASPAAPVDEAPAGDRVFDYLPEQDEIDMSPMAADLPGIWYGVLGVAGGMLIGILSAYLAGMVL